MWLSQYNDEKLKMNWQPELTANLCAIPVVHKQSTSYIEVEIEDK